MAKKKTTKVLIEKSIEIYGMGHPDVKTVFNIEHEGEKKDPLFRDLSKISGRKLTVRFKILIDTEETPGQIQMQIPTGTEDEIKTFILAEINNYMASL